MTTQSIYPIDQSSRRIAVLDVALIGDRYRGTICLDATPPELKRLFEEFEENVEGQMFPFADDIEEKIGAIRLKVVFPNGTEACVKDLQIYPSTKRVSFTIRQTSTTKVIAQWNDLLGFCEDRVLISSEEREAARQSGAQLMPDLSKFRKSFLPE